MVGGMRSWPGTTAALLRLMVATPVKTFTSPDHNWRAARWTPDGHAISYLHSQEDLDNGTENVWELPLDGGPPKPVTHFTSKGMFFGYDWSSDGRLALSRGTRPHEMVLIRNFQ